MIENDDSSFHVIEPIAFDKKFDAEDLFEQGLIKKLRLNEK